MATQKKPTDKTVQVLHIFNKGPHLDILERFCMLTEVLKRKQ